ncbi:hypothetical protein EYZ11_003440 [Aspergillus tanneri]|uniref:Non-haem dioxygenase N-terminal domain-containing protein n=1 Tax=Aspergillus tanneri TaxID=1220188 RepID=A0A4S3JNA2_9EURO|nr:hypothetical protein EYZ11_003440 [Aspergillus tanneri]
MTVTKIEIPNIDMRDYYERTSPTSKEEVVAHVRTTCLEHGFFQIEGHGVSLDIQRYMLAACKTFFDLPIDEKTELSLYKNTWRRGYEGPGEQEPFHAVLLDQKEGPGWFLKGPNIWPEHVPTSQFRRPVEEYFDALLKLGHREKVDLIVGMANPPSVLDFFTSNAAI